MKIINNHLENIKNKIYNNLVRDNTIKYYQPNITIDYRIKNTNKIFKKTIKNKTFPKDVIGFRIIVDHENNILPFNVLRNIELNYKVFPETYKNYITNKKSNDYQSLHICAYIDNVFLEIQIRTAEMDYCANFGKASNYH